MGLTDPKIVFCESKNNERVRDALKQLGKCIPIYSFDENDKNIEELLVKTEEEINFKYKEQKFYIILTVVYE